MSLLSIGMNLENKLCAIVGGGSVGYRKAMHLLEAGAFVDVYSLDFNADFLNLSSDRCRLKKSDILEQNVKYFLIIAATDSQKVNDQIATEAKQNGSLINHVGNKNMSDFVTQAVTKKNNLTLSINTNGFSPEFSRQLRMYIEGKYINEWSIALDLYEDYRKYIHSYTDSKSERLTLLRELDLEQILYALKSSSKKEVLERLIECLSY